MNNINYYFLWNYNKFPLVYSIMKTKEENVLIINIQDSLELEDQLKKLDELDKIYKVILIKNNYKEYIFNIIYRITVYPFKKKEKNITFYLDGFAGYYPLVLANIGNPNKVVFYEEGESIYCKKVFFNKKKLGFKNLLNEFIKKILLIRKNSINDIKKFYVRDKNRFINSLKNYKYEFDIIEVDENKNLNKISDEDKKRLIDIFFNKTKFDKKEKKLAIVLTQPIYLDNIYTKKETADLFNLYIKKLSEENYKIYLKLHPREKEDYYLKEGIERIEEKFPFELLSLFGIEFEVGLTYNSTAINSKLIKNKILIKDEVKK